MPKVKVDGVEIEVENGTTVLQACEIPYDISFEAHPRQSRAASYDHTQHIPVEGC